MKQTIMEMSADAKMLIDMLRNVAEGDTVTYAAMSSEIGRDIQKERGAMYTARSALIKENIVFDTVREEGLRRMTPSEIAQGAGRKSIKRIGREARRGIKTLRCAASGELSNSDLARMNTDASVLGVMSLCTREKKLNALECKVAEAGREMPIAKTLEMFKG